MGICTFVKPPKKANTGHFKYIFGLQKNSKTESFHGIFQCENEIKIGRVNWPTYLLFPQFRVHVGKVHMLVWILSNSQNRRSNERTSFILETSINTMMLHCSHTHKASTNMAIDNICPCPSVKHDLIHWKCIVQCWSNCPSLVIPGQLMNREETNMCPKIRFHVYILVSWCTVHGRWPYE